MKLMTKALEKKFSKFPLYSQDDKGMNAQVITKYFNPFGSQTWYILEGSQTDDGDWEFFSYYTDNCYQEYGYVTLSQIEEAGVIERDIYSTMKTLGEMLKGAGLNV